MAIKILDCTLRDGGYYTQWDFNWEFVKTYLECIENTPIGYIEIGYRSTVQKKYLGEYYYLPKSTVKKISELSTKKLAVMLDIKNLDTNDLDQLLSPIINSISMVRLATNPYKIEHALRFAKEIKQKYDIEVALNLMYFGKWIEDEEFLEELKQIETEYFDYLYFVDSYGSIMPSSLENIRDWLQSLFNSVKIGFHGHNNQEMALANSLKMVDLGVDIIDSTILGMGRGAGNLKTELLCLSLKKNNEVNFELSSLNSVIEMTQDFKNKYKWGEGFAYNISGAYSIEQALVMDWLSDKFYSDSNIISALENRITTQAFNTSDLEKFPADLRVNKAIMIGGGESVTQNSRIILEFLSNNQDVALIFTSTKFYEVFKETDNHKIICLVGDESKRLMTRYSGEEISCVVLDSQDNLTSIPEKLVPYTYTMEGITFSDKFQNAHTCLGIQAAIDFGLSEIWVLGYDGYSTNITEKQHRLSLENEYLFAKASEHLKITALLPTNYNLNLESLYSKVL